jgi:hypothetical protein
MERCGIHTKERNGHKECEGLVLREKYPHLSHEQKGKEESLEKAAYSRLFNFRKKNF